MNCLSFHIHYAFQKKIQYKGTIINNYKMLLSELYLLEKMQKKTSKSEDVHQGNYDIDYSKPISVADI